MPREVTPKSPVRAHLVYRLGTGGEIVNAESVMVVRWDETRAWYIDHDRVEKCIALANLRRCEKIEGGCRCPETERKKAPPAPPGKGDADGA